jgi:hypothetical protein
MYSSHQYTATALWAGITLAQSQVTLTAAFSSQPEQLFQLRTSHPQPWGQFTLPAALA